MKKILIWGTGNLARKFIENKYAGEMIGFIETTKTKDTFMQKPVYSSDEIPEGYDYIVVANSYATEIYSLCKKLKIEISKLIFLYGVKSRIGCTDQSVLKEILGGKNYTNYCAEFGLIDETFLNLDAIKYQELNRRPSFDIQERYMCPMLNDKYAAAGTMNNYFWQDLWAAKLIYKSGVRKHFDIGSRIDGFIAHLLAMDINVSLIDIREFPGEVENLHTIVDDATSLKQIADNSIDSMSALCSLEHFGLGRYGDSIDPEACFKCFAEIQKKIKVGGNLYISLPIGKERVEFNAHRVFYVSTILECFDQLILKEFSCTAAGRIEYDVEIHKYDGDSNNGDYRYGLFHFTKG